jgi:hypothetical protein
MRRTLTDCGGLLCTVSDVTDLPVGSCTVDSVGKCNIKTTVNSTSPGALSGGKRTSVEIFGVAMMNGALKVLSGGVLLH